MNIRKFYLESLGKKIKLIRQRKGWSQETLSFKCGLHRTYIGSVERGEKNITIINLYKIANSLGVPITDLLSFDNEEKGE